MMCLARPQGAEREESPSRDQTVLSDEQLQDLEVPTLFLVGENEKIYPAHAAIQRLKEVAPDIEAVMIPDAGHDLTLVQAELVDNTILEFLGKDRDAH